MKVIAWIVRIAIFAVLVAFSLGNLQPATVSLFGRPDLALTAPVVVFLLAFFALGLILGLAVHAGKAVARQREVTQLRRELERLEATRPTIVDAQIQPGTGGGFSAMPASAMPAATAIEARPTEVLGIPAR